MSALRRLTSSFRSERRSEQACPYSRPQPSPPKPKPTRRPRYWDFFNFFSFLAPYSDEEEEEAKKEAEAKAKASQQAETIVVPEQDSEMSDASVSASSSEESTTTTSDSSVETVETAETAEHAEPAESTKPFGSVQPTRIAEPIDSAESPQPVDSVMLVEPAMPLRTEEPLVAVSTQAPISSVSQPPQPLNHSAPPEIGVPSSSAVPREFADDDDFLGWVKRKVDMREGMNNTDFLTFKMFMENRRKELEYEPIKVRFMPRHTSPLVTDTRESASGANLCHGASLTNNCIPNPTSSQQASFPTDVSAPSYISGFHSSTGLPPFKNNIRPSRTRKVLKVDPNGPLSLRGAGSARTVSEEGRKRPAPLVKLRFDPYKRRRLFDEAKGPVGTPVDAASQGVPSNASGSSSSVPPRLARTGINRQHPTPHVPSPLRNVINGSPPQSPPVSSRTIPTNLNATSSSRPTQTASAAFLQEVVEKSMPRRPRYSDVVNPYQASAPVKPVIKPMVRKRMSERRAGTKEAEKKRVCESLKEAEKREWTVREIIEATVPKGAKRSRPPPGLAKSRTAGTAGPGASSKRVLEEPEEGSTPTKKRRTVTVEDVSEEQEVRNRSVPARPNVIIESRSPSPEPTPTPSAVPTEVLPAKQPSTKTVTSKGASLKTIPVMQPTAKGASGRSVKEPSIKVSATKEQASKLQVPPKIPPSKESSTKVSARGSSAKGPSNHFSPLLNSKVAGKSSAPREPSKLRTSFLPDECENEEPKMASPTPSATVTMTTPGTPLADIQEKRDPKEVALTLPLNDLPSFVFKTPPALVAGDHTDARVAAKELPVTSLPKFDFSKARTAMNGVIFPAVPIPTIKPFDFESAGAKPNATPSNDQWQCPTCMLQNSASAVEKCSICEAPRPGAQKPKKVAVNGINGVNGAKTPAGVTGKIVTPKSSSTSTTSPTGKTFDFAAAGLTPKAPVVDGQWTCSTCILQNPATAIEKCIVCDSPRPGAEKTEKVEKSKKPYVNGTAHSSKNLLNGVASPTAKSFDFSAAGLVPKASPANGNWYCPTCMLQNPATALEKCKVCDSPRPGTEKATWLPVVPVKSIPQLVPKSFDWAGAGMVPKFNGSSWTCGTCMLSNPPTETEKCKVCDASRS